MRNHADTNRTIGTSIPFLLQLPPVGDPLCAGCAQMRRIGEILTRRDQVARKYDELLRDAFSLVLPLVELHKNCTNSAGLCYVVRLANDIRTRSREMLLPACCSGVVSAAAGYFAPIHSQPRM